jgi:metallo-beta-lactamase class B
LKREDLNVKNLRTREALLLGVAIVVVAGAQAFAQELPAKLPTKEDLAKNNKLFIELATKYLHWD